MATPMPPARTTTRIAGRWRRLLGANELELRLGPEAWCALFLARAALRLAPRRVLAGALADPLAAAPGAEGDSPETLARAVSMAAAAHPGAVRCLPRALALARLLAARGHAARVRIGVRKEGGGLAAHAWVEVGGAPVGEPEAIEARFLPLIATSGAASAPSS